MKQLFTSCQKIGSPPVVVTRTTSAGTFADYAKLFNITASLKYPTIEKAVETFLEAGVTRNASPNTTESLLVLEIRQDGQANHILLDKREALALAQHLLECSETLADRKNTVYTTF